MGSGKTVIPGLASGRTGIRADGKGMKMARIMAGKVIAAMILLFAVEGCTMTMPNPETKVLTGTIRIVGNEPFTHVVLTVGESADQAIGGRDYLIVGPLGDQLRKKHQGKKLTVHGTFCTSPVPGFTKCFNPSKIVAGEGGCVGK